MIFTKMESIQIVEIPDRSRHQECHPAIVRSMECRVRNSISLIKAYQGFLQAVDPLADGFHGLDSGTMTRPAMIQLHNDAKQAKAVLKAAYDLYWSPPLEVPVPQAWAIAEADKV